MNTYQIIQVCALQDIIFEGERMHISYWQKGAKIKPLTVFIAFDMHFVVQLQPSLNTEADCPGMFNCTV